MKIFRSVLQLIVFLLLLGFVSPAFAQLEEAIEQLTGENTESYLQPFMKTFCNNLNTGINRSAHVPKTGFDFFVGVIAMGTIIPDADLTCECVPPEPYPQDAVETASVFGGEGTTVDGGGGLQYTFPDGQLQGRLFPFAVPHLEIGSLFGTRLKFRWFGMEIPGSEGENLGKIQLLGYGLQHSISQYFPLLPVDLSASFFMQTFDVGDYISASALSFGVQGSKKFSVLTLYGGLYINSGSMDVSYTYDEGGEDEEEISLEFDSITQFRFTMGAALKLTFFHLNGDISFGSQTTFSLGIGFGV